MVYISQSVYLHSPLSNGIIFRNPKNSKNFGPGLRSHIWREIWAKFWKAIPREIIMVYSWELDHWSFEMFLSKELTQFRKIEINIFFSFPHQKVQVGKKRGLEISDILRTKRNQIISNWLSFDWHPSLSDDIKFENIKNSGFWGCWRISLGKKNFSWVFEGFFSREILMGWRWKLDQWLS